jgi:type IV secretion system protein VirD4
MVMSSANRQGAVPRGILLGWEESEVPGSFGFARRSELSSNPGSPVVYHGDAPGIVIGTTGSGKGRGMLIPNALLHDGPLIAIDIKGEIAACCARYRHSLGQKVVFLDPFGTITDRSSCLNPFDLLTLPGAEVDSDAEMLASLLAVGHEFVKEPFWNITASGLIAGLIAHIATTESPNNRHLGRLREWLFHDDFDFALATSLDKKLVRCRMAYEQFVAS